MPVFDETFIGDLHIYDVHNGNGRLGEIKTAAMKKNEEFMLLKKFCIIYLLSLEFSLTLQV